jgi:hypothetical protein
VRRGHFAPAAALAAQKAIGIVGIAFDLTVSLVDNSTSIVLYELPASSIRGIVRAQRDILRKQEGAHTNVLASVNNQGLAAARLGEYIQYCTPVTIEANIAVVLGRTWEMRTERSRQDRRARRSRRHSRRRYRRSPPASLSPRPTAHRQVQAGLPPAVQRDLVTLLNRVRAVSEPARLQALAGALGLDPNVPNLRPDIVVEINGSCGPVIPPRPVRG